MAGGMLSDLCAPPDTPACTTPRVAAIETTEAAAAGRCSTIVGCFFRSCATAPLDGTTVVVICGNAICCGVDVCPPASIRDAVSCRYCWTVNVVVVVVDDVADAVVAVGIPRGRKTDPAALPT